MDLRLGQAAFTVLALMAMSAFSFAAEACPMSDTQAQNSTPFQVAQDDSDSMAAESREIEEEADDQIMDESSDPMTGVEDDVMGDGDMGGDEAGADMDGADVPSEGDTMD